MIWGSQPRGMTTSWGPIPKEVADGIAELGPVIFVWSWEMEEAPRKAYVPVLLCLLGQ